MKLSILRNWRAGAIALGLFLGGVAVAVAVNAPTYKDPAGVLQPAAGVILVNPDGSFADFGGIDLVAQRLAALAVQKSQGEVDDRLKASIKSSLKIDISGLLRTAGPLKTEMDKALAAWICTSTNGYAQWTVIRNADGWDGFVPQNPFS